jgi:hypothetical protein
MICNQNDRTVSMESFRRKGHLLRGGGTLRGSGEAPRAAWLDLGGRRGLYAILGKSDHASLDGSCSLDFVLYAAYRLIELPAIRYGQKLNRRIHVRASAASHGTVEP